jgi:hypothetical protein
VAGSLEPKVGPFTRPRMAQTEHHQVRDGSFSR